MNQKFEKIQIDRVAPIPIYQQILNEIRARISNGKWSAGIQIPTEAELESELQVSRVTIRQALSAAVEEGLIIRMPGKGTFVSGTPKALTKTEKFIGYVVPHLSSNFNVQILLGVESVLKEKGYRLIFCNSEGKLSKENQLLQSLEADAMAGYIIQPVYTDEDNRVLARIALKGEPIVLIDRGLPGIQTSSVMSDHLEGGRKIVRHLIDRGYRDIVYLARQPIQLPSIAERLQGYQVAMREAGLIPRAPIVVGGPIELGYLQDDDSPTIEEQAVIERISGFLSSPERPEAIVAMNDLVAMLVIEAAKEADVCIPEDMGLVGFDNLDCAVTYNLTTVAQQSFEIGSEAARLLIQRVQDGKETIQQIRLPTNLIVRDSSLKHH
jgi:GntR family transcriptional regulator, arabinose operon transcriptional repressor